MLASKSHRCEGLSSEFECSATTCCPLLSFFAANVDKRVNERARTLELEKFVTANGAAESA